MTDIRFIELSLPHDIPGFTDKFCGGVARSVIPLVVDRLVQHQAVLPGPAVAGFSSVPVHKPERLLASGPDPEAF